MSKYKVYISKSIEEEIEANSEKEALDLAWEQFSQYDECEVYLDEIE